MATKDLISATRAEDALGGATANTANLTLSANESTTLGVLITAISDAIEKYCRRRFVSTAYDEIYNGERRPPAAPTAVPPAVACRACATAR